MDSVYKDQKWVKHATQHIYHVNDLILVLIIFAS